MISYKRWLIALLLFSIVACQDTAPLPPPVASTEPVPVHLWIGVTDDAAGLLSEVSAAYKNSRAVLHVISGNSHSLYDDLATGQLDAVILNYIPPNNDLWVNPLALDGLVFIVHPDNPVRELTRPELQAIFSGRINNWADVGGPSLPIMPQIREQGAGARQLFQERVMQEQRVTINAVLQPAYTAVLEAVAADPQAIGYTTLSGLPAGVAVLTVEGFTPEPNTVGTQQYPLTVPLYFLADGEPNGQLRHFLSWLQSAEGQAQLGQKVGRAR